MPFGAQWPPQENLKAVIARFKEPGGAPPKASG